MTFASLNGIDMEEGTAFAPRFDEHGLIPAIAISPAGEVLMVAFMNAEALRLTLATGEVHFWSRSRKSLWRKGETSGNRLVLREMRTDCDQDALAITAELQGAAACHTGRRTCFYRRVRSAGDGSFILEFVEDEPAPLPASD